MANDLTRNPWIVDTCGIIQDDSATFVAVGGAQPTFAVPAVLRIKGIRWVGATTAGHLATLTDSSSRTFWTSIASGSNYLESDRPQVLNANPRGLRLQQLGSGTLYIELG